MLTPPIFYSIRQNNVGSINSPCLKDTRNGYTHYWEDIQQKFLGDIDAPKYFTSTLNLNVAFGKIYLVCVWFPFLETPEVLLPSDQT